MKYVEVGENDILYKCTWIKPKYKIINNMMNKKIEKVRFTIQYKKRTLNDL